MITSMWLHTFLFKIFTGTNIPNIWELLSEGIQEKHVQEVGLEVNTAG